MIGLDDTQRQGKMLKEFQDTMKLLTERHGNDFQTLVSEFASEITNEEGRAMQDYLRHVFFPTRFPPVRVPSPFPHSTHLSKQDFSANLIPDATTGNAIIEFSPNQYIGNVCLTYAQIDAGGLIQNKVELGSFGALNTNSLSYRLISACMEITYIGAADALKGYYVGGCTYVNGDNNWILPGVAALAPAQSVVEDYTEVVEYKTQQGSEWIWMPIDSEDTDFKQAGAVGIARPNKQIVVYLAGMPVAQGACIRIKIHRFYESIPNAAIKDYIVTKKGTTIGGGANTVQQIMGQASKALQEQGQTLTSHAIDTVGHIAKTLGTQVISSVQKSLPNYLENFVSKKASGLATGILGGGLASGLGTLLTNAFKFLPLF